MKRSVKLPWVLALVSLGACSPETPTSPGPIRAMVLSCPSGDEGCALEVVSIASLTDVGRLRGAAATAWVDATITANLQFLSWATTDDEMRAAFSVAGAKAPSARLIERDGVYWSADYQTLNMITAYYNFERARDYSIAHGAGEEVLRGVPFYYFPNIPSDTPPEVLPREDNAAWLGPIDGFLFLRENRFKEIPLPMNLGVIAHEYSHGLFNRLALGGSAAGYPLEFGQGGSAAELIMALQEGFADAFAVGATGDPDYIAHSLSGEQAARSVEQITCYKDHALGTPLPDPYALGTVFAAALYESGGLAGTDYDRVLRTLIASYPRIRESISTIEGWYDFGNVEAPLQAIALSAVDEPTRTALCDTFLDRFSQDTPTNRVWVPACEDRYPMVTDRVCGEPWPLPLPRGPDCELYFGENGCCVQSAEGKTREIEECHERAFRSSIGAYDPPWTESSCRSLNDDLVEAQLCTLERRRSAPGKSSSTAAGDQRP